MNHLPIIWTTGQPGQISGGLSGQQRELLARVVRDPPGERPASWPSQLDGVPRCEATLDRDDAGRKQAAATLANGFLGARIDQDSASRSAGEREPSLAGGPAAGPWPHPCADGLAVQDP